MVWPSTTKFGMITRGGAACFQGLSHAHQIRLPRLPKIPGTSYMGAHSMRDSNQIMCDQTRCDKIFTWSTMPPAMANIFGDTATQSACGS